MTTGKTNSTKPLFIGMNPTKAKPRKGNALDRFKQWIDAMDLGFVAFSNLSPDPYWDKKRVDHVYVRSIIGSHTTVVALGGMVSNVLTELQVDHYALPHPSPLNRQINDHEYIQLKLKECMNYING